MLWILVAILFGWLLYELGKAKAVKSSHWRVPLFLLGVVSFILIVLYLIN